MRPFQNAVSIYRFKDDFSILVVSNYPSNMPFQHDVVKTAAKRDPSITRCSLQIRWLNEMIQFALKHDVCRLLPAVVILFLVAVG